ncbi:hypothetical protein J4E89_000142 [Alternaria sp. Ai002NY15]|nr:hypothetical protein J4E89_000142 [Alternaria sp. Ai002NY15]
MSTARTVTSPVSLDRTIHDAILAALALPTLKAKVKALKGALQDWQGDAEAGVKSPHLLVHIFDRLYELEALPGALTKQDSTNFKALREVCDELGFKMLFARVDKALGGCTFIAHNKIASWTRSRPKFDIHKDWVFIDRLTLEHVVDVHGESLPGCLPLLDSEVIQEHPFTYKTASVQTCEGVKSMKSGMEYGLWHFHDKAALVIIPPRNITAYEVRQCLTIPVKERVYHNEDLWEQYGPDLGSPQADSKTIIQMLDKATKNGRKLHVDTAEDEHIREICELFYGYYDKEKSGWHTLRRFPALREEALERLTAVSVEYGSQDIWRRAVEMLDDWWLSKPQMKADITAETLCHSLHQSLGKEYPEKASYLVNGTYGLETTIAVCNKIKVAFEASHEGKDDSAEIPLSDALAAYKSSMIRKVLATSKMDDYALIPQAGRVLEDEQLIQDTLHQVFKNATPPEVARYLQRMTELKDGIPDYDVQRYCEIILSANVEVAKSFGTDDLEAVKTLLTSSLPLPEATIQDYCKKLLQAKHLGHSYDYDDSAGSFIILEQKLGEEYLLVLLPLLTRTFARNIPWLITLLTRVKSSKPWTSDAFLPKFADAVIGPAIDGFYLNNRRCNQTIREINHGNAGATKDELERFLQLLKDMGLGEMVDKLTDKMARSDQLKVDEFQDALAKKKTAYLAKKRKAMELADIRQEKKSKAVR